MTSDRTILITGVTGHQGGAVARALQGTGFSLRGLTRKPEGERAATLRRALAGVDTALMLEWFERVGYSADIAGLEREFGRALTKLPEWIKGHRP